MKGHAIVGMVILTVTCLAAEPTSQTARPGHWAKPIAKEVGDPETALSESTKIKV